MAAIGESVGGSVRAGVPVVPATLPLGATLPVAVAVAVGVAVGTIDPLGTTLGVGETVGAIARQSLFQIAWPAVVQFLPANWYLPYAYGGMMSASCVDWWPEC